MFCPRCGQQQATDSMRFCSRCGFSMEGVMHLLNHGGMLPQYSVASGEQAVSPRRRGVKQGVLLMLLGAILVPILGVMNAFGPDRLSNMFTFFTALAAIICFIGGPLRMLFAAVFEEGARTNQFVSAPAYSSPAIPPQRARVAALPPPTVNAAEQWNKRPQTAEILQPPSVTDHTTKLLDKSERENE